MRKFVLTIFSILLFGSAWAQNRPVSGTVTDGSGSPIAGVTVVLENSRTAGVTDPNGHYSLVNVPADGSLEFTHLGMVTQIVPVNGRSIINVVMETDAAVLDDIVVTGYGALRRSAFTGSASVVGESIVNSKTDPNFLKTLDGAVTGLKMSSQSGIPGGYTDVYIRGIGSINSGREPLYVIDGMPIWSDKEGMSDRDLIYYSPMANINSNDIESVTVLKDATATALYGARAANGVIVITTKRGKEGRFNLDFDMKFGFNQIAPYTDKYKLVGSEKYYDIWNKSIEAAGADPADYLLPDDGTNTDWMDVITRNGAVHDINLSVSGSTPNVSYFSSLGYLKNEGFLIGSGTERFSGRLNLEARSKIFTYGMNTSYTQSLFDGIPNSSSYSNPVVVAYDTTPNVPVYNPDGSYNLTTTTYGYNPVAMTDPTYGNIQRQNIGVLNANPYLAVNFGYGISAKTSLGVSIYDLKEYQYWSSTLSPDGIDYKGLGQQYNSQRTNITWTNTLNWLYSFNEVHNVNVMLGQEMQRQKYFWEFYSATDFPLDGIRDMATASKENGTGQNANEYARMASYFMNAEYDYDNRYYISGSFRRDGSSAFGRDNRWGNFWSVGAKWRVTEEAFLKNNKTLSNLAIRASYGTVGNSDIGWYSARGFYTAGYNYNSKAGMIPTAMSNPDLGWEQSNKFNFGLDLGLFNRVDVNIDVYDETTKDMIFAVPLSFTTGLATTYRNIGSMRNRGIEVGITASIIRNQNLAWTFYANMTYNKNEVVALADNESIEGEYSKVEVGQPYYQFFMKEYAGVDPDNGDPLWWSEQDANGNSVEEYKTNDWNLATKRSVGSADPKFYGGFGTALSFKGLDFAMNFSYQLGGKVYNAGHGYDLQAGHYVSGPVSNYVYDNAWTEDNRNTQVPKFVAGSNRGEYNTSSRFLYSSNMLRLKTITLGYTLPRVWTEKAYMQKVRIYVTVDNLFTVKNKNFIGFDPESAPNGVQMWPYPAGRTFSAGLSIGF